MEIIILGAGPAGLTAGYEASKRKELHPTILEMDTDVGGISKTVSYKDYLFDIGGHRFFTKYEEVQNLWDEILGDEFLTRPRLSRIYYGHKFYYYPLKPLNALTNLGVFTSAHVVLSYLYAQLRPYKDVENFEQWISNKFGKKLFNIFFKTYTEKVWGTPCSEIQADWAAQRIKGLSLGKAILNSLGFLKRGQVTTLIDEFQYPRKGPGQMWNRAKELIEEAGGSVRLSSRVNRIDLEGDRVVSVQFEKGGRPEVLRGEQFLSTLPLRELVKALNPQVPDAVREAAEGLKYRDFFTVGLIIDKPDIIPDNWIYIHSPDVRVGRIQNFKNWSPDMVPDPATTSLGLEYFCFDTDEIWHRDDRDLIALAAEEVEKLRFASREEVLDGIVIRSPKTYPVYDQGYARRVEIIRDYLSGIKNLQTMGRNGLHRYNNQDHSMLSALYAVRNILGGEELDVWDINIDEEYHEIKEEGDGT
jgi:protoporphyrinogen oxidase